MSFMRVRKGFLCVPFLYFYTATFTLSAGLFALAGRSRCVQQSSMMPFQRSVSSSWTPTFPLNLATNYGMLAFSFFSPCTFSVSVCVCVKMCQTDCISHTCWSVKLCLQHRERARRTNCTQQGDCGGLPCFGGNHLPFEYCWLLGSPHQEQMPA